MSIWINFCKPKAIAWVICSNLRPSFHLLFSHFWNVWWKFQNPVKHSPGAMFIEMCSRITVSTFWSRDRRQKSSRKSSHWLDKRSGVLPFQWEILIDFGRWPVLHSAEKQSASLHKGTQVANIEFSLFASFFLTPISLMRVCLLHTSPCTQP